MPPRISPPTLADIFVAAAVVWLLAASAPGSIAGLLQDGDTGVHIRTGLLILDTGAIPTADPYSWTKPGAPWIAWEWLTDVLFALLYRAGGLAAVLAACAAVIAATVAVLLRRVANAAADAILALALTSVCLGITQIHLLVRPHIFTLLFLAISMCWLDSDDSNDTRRTLWRLPLLTVLWVNLHGGVFALFAILGALTAAAALERRWPVARRLALTALLCLAASLATPFGTQLHAHVLDYLSAGWIRENVAEFRPLDPSSATALWFHALLFASLLAAAADLRRRRFARPILIAMWGHLALTSARHVPLFVIIAAPTLAEAAGAAWRSLSTKTLVSVGADHLPGLRRFTAWAAVLPAAVVFAMPIAHDYPTSKYPVEFLSAHARTLTGTRLFTTDEWADYIVYRAHPNARVFLDGRSDFFGPAIVEDYKRILAASSNWQAILDRHRADAVLMPRDSAVAGALRASAAWQLTAEAGGAALFKRYRNSLGR